MKTKILLITILFLTLLSLVSLNIFQSSGPHGGIVKPAGDYFIEMKNTSLSFYTYLLNEKYKPMSNKGVTCAAEFVFPDSTSMKLDLKPFGEDGFSIESNTLKFYSCIINFSVSGKTISAAFDNENPIVQHNKQYNEPK